MPSLDRTTRDYSSALERIQWQVIEQLEVDVNGLRVQEEYVRDVCRRYLEHAGSQYRAEYLREPVRVRVEVPDLSDLDAEELGRRIVDSLVRGLESQQRENRVTRRSR